jgi:hypothetical protein
MGEWFKITPKLYEPEKQSVGISWLQIKNKITPEEGYRRYFQKQREEAKILYPSFRKDVE